MEIELDISKYDVSTCTSSKMYFGIYEYVIR